jgi:hypothetical protein
LYEFKMPYNIPQAAIAMANAPCSFILQDIVALNHYDVIAIKFNVIIKYLLNYP